MRMLKKKNAIAIAAVVMLVFVVFNTFTIINNNQKLQESTELKSKSQQTLNLSREVLDGVIRNLDLGLRGYALTGEEQLLGPLHSGMDMRKRIFVQLEAGLKEQHYPDMSKFYALRDAVEEYVKYNLEMVALVEAGNMQAFTEALKKDKGYDLWLVYAPFQEQLTVFENERVEKAEGEYSNAMRTTLLAQIMLALIGIPTLVFMILRIRKVERKRSTLFQELESNNRQHLFNPGTAVDISEEKALITSSISNYQQAAQFIREISGGNYQIDWQGLCPENLALNKTNLVGELIAMREQMKKLKQEDERRLWASEGTSKFSEMVRRHQNNLQELCDQVVYFVVKYLEVQQGALFLVVDEGQEEEKYLELKGCYAFNRKKHLSKRLVIGEGLVGQAYLEKSTLLITDVPQDYINISSGMGHARPKCVVIVPMMHNQQVSAVLEIAGFEPLETYQREFLEKIGEITASALVSVQSAEKTDKLLVQFREQTEMMRSQEEEMRQNMEELEATQEEMRRKELAMEQSQQELRELLEQAKRAAAHV